MWAAVALTVAATVLVAPPAGAYQTRSAPVAEVGDLVDVPPGHPFYADISWLIDRGISEGYPGGTFGPLLPVTRQAMAAFLYRFSEGPGEAPGCAQAPFPDVDPDHPFCGEIAWLAEQGITTGFGEGDFGPDRPVTRQAMAAFLYREAGSPEGDPPTCESQPFGDVPFDHPFCGEIAWLAAQGVSVGFADGTFGAGGSITRQAMAAFMRRLALLDDPGTPVPSAGCGSSEAASVVKQRVDMEVGEADRWFLLTTPPAHDGETPIPLVVDFHGLAEGATIHTSMSAYSDFALLNGFAVAFPQGTGSPVRWNVAADDTNPDLAFVDAILDSLGEQLCLDESRVYATGLSYGAFMTSRLACSRSSRFAAVAPVAGVVMPQPCGTSRAVPLLTFHGTADAILRYEGGVGLGDDPPIIGPVEDPPQAPAGVDLETSYPQQVAAWAARNSCLPNPVDTVITEEVIHRVYRCPTGAAVEFYIVVGGGHAWPGSTFSQLISFAVGYTTMDIVATELSWEFFQRYHLPAD